MATHALQGRGHTQERSAHRVPLPGPLPIEPGLDRGRLIALGIGWAAATVLFEFGFGHWVAGHPWSRLVADYDLLAGRIWVLVLLTLLIGPGRGPRAGEPPPERAASREGPGLPRRLAPL